MKRTLTGACLLALCSVSFGASLQGSIDQLINRLNPHVNLGMVVVDLTSGETLYKRNAEQLFIPASNMKLFSEAATLMALGPDYRFKNQISTSATHLHDGVLQGNLYLHLSGFLIAIFCCTAHWPMPTHPRTARLFSLSRLKPTPQPLVLALVLAWLLITIPPPLPSSTSTIAGSPTLLPGLTITVRRFASNIKGAIGAP